MNSVVRVLINIFLTTTLWATNQSTASGSNAGNHLYSGMRSRQRMLQKQNNRSASEHPTHYTATQNTRVVPTRTEVIYKPEVTHESYLAGPSYTRPQQDGSQSGATLPHHPRRFPQSASRAPRRVWEQVPVSAPQPRNSYSSLSIYPERVIISLNPSRRYITSTKTVDHRLGEDFGLYNSKKRGSFSSSAIYSERLSVIQSRNPSYRFRKSTRLHDSGSRKSDLTSSNYLGGVLKTGLHSRSTNGEWWRKTTNFATHDDAEITDQSVARFTTNRKGKVHLKTELDNALVNEALLLVQVGRDIYIRDGIISGYESGPCNFNKDKDDTKTHRCGCKSCGSARRRRDGGSSDKTTQDYALESRAGVGDSVNGETTLPQEEKEVKLITTQKMSKSVSEVGSLGNITIRETTESYTSLPNTTIEANPHANVSLPKDALVLVTTPGDDHIVYRSTVEDSLSQQTSGDGGEDGVSCEDTSDFGEYGIRTLAVSLGIVVLLVYVLVLVLVTRRFLSRARFKAAGHCPQVNQVDGWLHVVSDSFPFDTEIEEPITDSRSNLMALNTSLTYDSDPGGDTSQEDNSYKVSTFLLRRESQQKAEDRARQGREEIQHDRFEMTTQL